MNNKLENPVVKVLLAIIGAVALWKFFNIGELLQFFFLFCLIPFAWIGFIVVAMVYCPDAANSLHEKFVQNINRIKAQAELRRGQVEEALANTTSPTEESA